VNLFDRPRFRRVPHGYGVRLPEIERSLLVHLPEQLLDLLGTMTPDRPIPAGAEKLFPRAHPTDDEAEARYEATFRASLLANRQDALERLAATAHADRLSDEDGNAWLEAMNALRLVIGARIGVTEEMGEILESDPSYADWICYQYLSFLESELVDAMAGALPAPSADDDLPDDPWGEPLGGLRWDGTPIPRETPQE
jgi:Domain of unknown function (DUF2017)